MFLGIVELTVGPSHFHQLQQTFFQPFFRNLPPLAAALDEFVSKYSVPRIITQYQGLFLSTRRLSGFLSDFCLHIRIKVSVSRPDDDFCLLSCHNSGSFPKGDGRECVFTRDNHKTASWVIDMEVICLIQDKISFAGPLQVCNIILSDNYFVCFEGVHLSMEIPRFQTFLFSMYYLCLYALLPYILKS